MSFIADIITNMNPACHQDNDLNKPLTNKWMKINCVAMVVFLCIFATIGVVGAFGGTHYLPSVSKVTGTWMTGLAAGLLSIDLLYMWTGGCRKGCH